MQPTLMQQGIELMLYGMGTVFVFLALLVLATSSMSALMHRFAKPEPVTQPSVASSRHVNSGNDDKLVAVITAAIHQYRSRKK